MRFSRSFTSIELINDWSPSPEASRQSSFASAARAVALDDPNADAHFAMGVVTALASAGHDEALRHAERAIALDPNHSDARLSLGVILHYAGRSEEALPLFDRSLAVDPLFDQILQFQAQAYLRAWPVRRGGGTGEAADRRQSHDGHLARLSRGELRPDGPVG